jgi:hypothetical protein
MFEKAFVALAIFVLPSASYAASSSQFDLLCSVNSHWGDNSGAELSSQSSNYAVHVDLLHREWCDRDCIGVQHIVDVSTHKMIFANSKDDDFMIDRDTGRLYRQQRIAAGPTGAYRRGSISGICHTKSYWTIDVTPLE